MNERSMPDGEHAEAWELIPWLVNGRASAQERARVEQHVERCSRCADELALQRRVQLFMLLDTSQHGDPDAAFRALRQRIESAAPDRSIQPLLARSRRLQAAVLVEALAIAVLAGVLWLRDDPRAAAPYRTLGDSSAATPPAATIRVVWARTATLDEVQRSLTLLGLEVVGGPGEAGVYSLAPLRAGADTAQQLWQLRADPNVHFAEPVGDAKVRR